MKIALALAVILLFAGAVPAEAALTRAQRAERIYTKVMTSATPVKTFKALTRKQKKLFRAWVMPHTAAPRSPAIKVAQPTTNATSRCWARQWEVYWNNAFGGKIWSYHLRVDWCGDGTRITDRYSRRWGVVHNSLFWSWSHHEQSSHLSAFTPQRWTRFVQAEFKGCLIAQFGCIKYVYPWHEARVWANGQATWEWGV